ncbi:MAG TPA: STAS domain-containing protein [Vicinamibacterales bacterium]|nr:STAS domain-containing protein [Vicinamibacterales bacterium]
MSGESGVVWFLRTSGEELGAVRVIIVEGRVSHATAAELAHVLAHRTANGLRAIVVDLSGVDYISGAGLRVFEKTAALLKQVNVDLLVCGLQPAVQAAFDLAGAIPNLAVAPSRDAALLQCQQPPRDDD